MRDLLGMVRNEGLKALRSRMPLWTALGSLVMPLGVAFLIFAARNPQLTQKLGLVGAKANLLAYSSIDWPAYLVLCGEIVAAGGFFLYIITVSWAFGREFSDGTLKDLLAVPVGRASIVLAKFIVVAAWSLLLSLVSFALSLAMGALLRLPGGGSGIILRGSALIWVTAFLTILLVTPFAFFASAGRGYMLPFGLAVLALILANLSAVLGWGEYFPWGVPGMYIQGQGILPAASYWIVIFTGLAGILATVLWWNYADQNR